MATIYIALLDEGTQVWRPVDARDLGAGVYEIRPESAPDEDERWEFGPGDLVRAERRVLSGGESVLVAVEQAVRAI